MKFLNVLALAGLAAAAKPTVYLIRHGEKPADGSQGLSPAGVKRAQCLRNVFGKSSSYNIGHIMAETPDDDGDKTRPEETVKPLASDLGLTVDVSCSQKDNKCVKDVVKNYKGSGDMLICWEHKQLNNIVKELGADDQDQYPDDAFNLIWVDPSPYSEVTQVLNENCPGLDS